MMSHLRVGVDRPNSYSNSIHIIYFKSIFLVLLSSKWVDGRGEASDIRGIVPYIRSLDSDKIMDLNVYRIIGVARISAFRIRLII